MSAHSAQPQPSRSLAQRLIRCDTVAAVQLESSASCKIGPRVFGAAVWGGPHWLVPRRKLRKKWKTCAGYLYQKYAVIQENCAKIVLYLCFTVQV